MPTDKNEQQFEDTPSGWASRWQMEFTAAKEATKKWHEMGEKVIARYLDERDGSGVEGETRWNFYWSNNQTLEALLHGKTPTADVQRRFNDAHDDVARVGGMMIERVLNADIEMESDGFGSAIRDALFDRLNPGLGNARCVYVAEFEEVQAQPAQTDPETGAELAPEVPAHQQKSFENVEVEYVHWKDQLWSPARTFREIRWWAFKVELTREESIKRFGEQVGQVLPLNSRRDAKTDDARKADPWARTAVWEIWDKEHRCVWWYVEGYPAVLKPVDGKPNANGSLTEPLGLKGFWPFPHPMAANLTTSKFIPRPDFILTEDVYNEIDGISTRITLLERAIKLAGVYEEGNDAVKRLLTEAAENQLVPVPNWGSFSEKGGLKGVIDWLPLEAIVAALDKLREYRSELINAHQQLTGFSDIMRGQASAPATATEQAIKARFGSVRIQRRQDEFARFATDLQRIKGEIIAKHFDAETILDRSNIRNTPDGKYAEAAVQLMKENFDAYRILVRPENVALADYAANEQEMTKVIAAVGGFLTQMLPLAQAVPEMAPHLFRILQVQVAKLRGGDDIETIIDEMISAAQEKLEQMQQQAAQAAGAPPPTDPKIEAAKIKAQGDIEKTKVSAQARQQEIATETKAEIVKRAADAHFNVKEEAARQQREGIAAMNAAVPGGEPT